MAMAIQELEQLFWKGCLNVGFIYFLLLHVRESPALLERS